MSSVSINTSATADIRRALSTNLAEATRSGIAMATGNAFNHAYEDPTGLAIGSKMKAERDILSIVATGIEQSKSMLYIAEEGLKSAENVVNQMNGILARAKLGFMNDNKLIQSTLSPAYQQLKDELNRIAESIDFNGQKLLNGTNGTVHLGSKSKVNKAQYDFTQVQASLKGLSELKLDCTARINNEKDAGPISLDIKSPISTEIIGGIFTRNNDGSITITNATLKVKGLTMTDTSLAKDQKEKVIGKADLVLTGIDFTVTKPSELSDNGIITDGAATIINAHAGGYKVSFENLGGNITKIDNVVTKTLSLTTKDALEISNVTASYEASGGQATTSEFKFVTGTNLAKDVITVQFPNIRLNDTIKDGQEIPGIISTLNVKGKTDSVASNGLTDLQSVEDANIDIPLMAALRDQIVEFRNALGAYQLRFVNLQDQLTSSLEQTDNAQAAILNADLPKNAEAATKSKVNVNLAISRLNESNNMLANLQKIVTG